jgi:hypothetical protein
MSLTSPEDTTRMPETLTDTQCRTALIAILETCATTPELMDAKLFREIRAIPAVEALTDKTLKQLITALLLTDLLWRAPHYPTNAARYVTTSLGKRMLDLYRQDSSEPSDNRDTPG